MAIETSVEPTTNGALAKTADGKFRLDAPSVEAVRPSRPEWGSDVAAEMLRRLGVEYAALNPGASYRGLHDSMVNYNGNQGPGMILCNHEEVAVAVAQGYAKFRGRAMAAILHSNVGLMHGSMAIFNAWVDRTPVLVLGGNGPMDSTLRRPWIDWIHTTHGQGELVRDYTKWEHQPASVAAIPEAMMRAWHAAHMEPAGPVYVSFDAGLQEQQLDPEQPITLLDPAQYPLPRAIEPPREAVDEALRWLVEAESPVILLGRTGQSDQAWRDLVELAETLGAAVLTDSKVAASFPTNHSLAQAWVSTRGGSEFNDILGAADVVLSLDRTDVAGTLRIALAPPNAPERGGFGNMRWPRLIHVSLEPFALRSWVGDFQELPPASQLITANVERTVAALLERAKRLVRDTPSISRRVDQRLEAHRARRATLEARWQQERERRWSQSPVSITRLVGDLRTAAGDLYDDAVLAHIPLTWPAGIWDFTRAGSYVGSDGGGGIGGGPGISVGTALAARSSGRLVVTIVGDGDMLMAPTALWTAAHHQIPLLFVVANNRSYFNDEEHQDRVARQRGRPPENRWIGQRIDNPPVSFADLARGMGVEAFGQISDADQLAGAYQQALAAVAEGRPALVDVHISPR